MGNKIQLKEVGDLENIQPYDSKFIVKTRMGLNWLYAFESEIGVINLLFQKLDDEVLKKEYNEDCGFLAGYNVAMLLKGQDKKDPGFKIDLNVYNRILKTCMEETFFFLSRVKPAMLFIRNAISIDNVGKEEEKIKKDMTIKFSLYKKIVESNIYKIPEYNIFNNTEGFSIKRDKTKEEEEEEKLYRLDRKGLLEGYIEKLIKETKQIL